MVPPQNVFTTYRAHVFTLHLTRTTDQLSNLFIVNQETITNESYELVNVHFRLEVFEQQHTEGRRCSLTSCSSASSRVYKLQAVVFLMFVELRIVTAKHVLGLSKH